eukprot:TRINITY_DN2720_c0_g1_i1.p1 TRINITY_DN2720_c0_g1~~TRINITY_DN2720_c0_g1_i1.p1  ORF type:complete len:159 (-),score=31.82 TRINITY_DN2720_c0_g1_i1:257-733(-)
MIFLLLFFVAKAFVSGDMCCFDQFEDDEQWRNCGGGRYGGAVFGTRSPVLSQHAAVATSHPIATDIGLDILKMGGSAVDAAIAVNAALGVMEPVSNGIGGDLFAMVWDPKTDRLYSLNGSGRSSKTLTLEDMNELLDEVDREMIPTFGPLGVTCSRDC